MKKHFFLFLAFFCGAIFLLYQASYAYTDIVYWIYSFAGGLVAIVSILFFVLWFRKVLTPADNLDSITDDLESLTTNNNNDGIENRNNKAQSGFHGMYELDTQGNFTKIEKPASSKNVNYNKNFAKYMDEINLGNYRTLSRGFIAIDVETTGMDTSTEKIIEVSAIKYANGVETDRFTSFINPEKPIPSSASKVNNITDIMVADSPTFCQIADNILDFIGDNIIVGHNVSFDRKFLFSEFSQCGKHFDNICLDTLGLSRVYFYDLSNYKLQTVLDEIGHDRNIEHRSESDAEGCAAILVHVLNNYANEYKITLVSNNSKAHQSNIANISYSNATTATLTMDESPGKGFYMVTCEGTDVGRLPKSANAHLKNKKYTVPVSSISKADDGKYSITVDLLEVAVENK